MTTDPGVLVRSPRLRAARRRFVDAAVDLAREAGQRLDQRTHDRMATAVDAGGAVALEAIASGGERAVRLVVASPRGERIVIATVVDAD